MTYDGTVRDSRGDIVQFRYGSDGLDPGEMEVENFPVDLRRELANIKVNTFTLQRPNVSLYFELILSSELGISQ